MFQQATAFATVSAQLHRTGLQTAPRNPLYAAPFVVNAAFAAELYLKTLSLKHGKAPLHDHKLVKLFDALPSAALEDLDTAIGALNCSPGISDRKSLRLAISGFSSAFENWRYIYERSDSDPIRVAELIFVVRVLHTACLPVAKTHVEADTAVEVVPVGMRLQF